MAANQDNNPLYKSLPLWDTTFEELFVLGSKSGGFLPVSFRNSLEANWIATEENFFQDLGVRIAEERFDCFCNELQKSSSIIPHMIHLIWLGSPPPSSVDVCIKSWKEHHPDWEIKLWKEEDLHGFAWSNPRSENFFNNGKNWAEKSDILRFEILYQYGGIYSDTDVICLNSFEDLTYLRFFAGFESNKIKLFGRPLIGSAIVGAEKNSQVIKQCIDLHQTQEEAPSTYQHLRSGPGPLSKASYEALEKGEEKVLLLPCSYFYPLPWEKRLAKVNEIIESIRAESLAIHLWEGSWFDSYQPPKSN